MRAQDSLGFVASSVLARLTWARPPDTHSIPINTSAAREDGTQTWMPSRPQPTKKRAKELKGIIPQRVREATRAHMKISCGEGERGVVLAEQTRESGASLSASREGPSQQHADSHPRALRSGRSCPPDSADGRAGPK